MSTSIEIRHIKCFLAVAETENFTRAAERLGVTQPCISQQIGHLERSLGAILFHRLGKRVRPTDAGKAFKDSAEAVLRKLEEASNSVGRVAGLLTGHAEIGVIPAVHLAWVPPVLGAIARDYPGLTVAVHERPSHDIETALESGRFDLGLGILSHSSPNLRYERLLSQPLSLIVPPKHPLASLASIAVKDLDGARLALHPSSFDMRVLSEQVFQRAHARPKVAYDLSTIESVLNTALTAGTPAVLPAIVLEGRATLGLQALPLTGKNRPIQFGMMWPRGSALAPAPAVFARILREMHAPPSAKPKAKSRGA